MQQSTQDILEQLNPQQREAVVQMDKPLLILAGAGTGKTRVLTSKIFYLISEQNVNPYEILAVTFSNRAAGEMKQRIPFQLKWIGTFHACCARILRLHGEVLGLKSNFTILNQDDQLKLVKQIIEDENISDKEDKDIATGTLNLINRWKDAALTYDSVMSLNRDFERKALKIYSVYQERLQIYGAVDFGDLILYNLALFRKEQSVLQIYRDKFKHIFVDEYQDTNIAQYLWLRAITPNGEGLCCVGDDDQSIYSWRGAEVGNILRFSKDFENASIIRLEQNYRSTKHILDAADGLISHNKQRLGKKLWSSGDQGEKITVQGLYTSGDEALWIAQSIIDLNRKSNLSLGSIAILIRAGFQAREIEEKLVAWGIPYRVIGGPRFYERQEIRDIVAYLRVIYQPDDGLALERIINTPRRGIGASVIQRLHAMTFELGITYFQALNNLAKCDEVRPSTRKSISEFIDNLNRWRSEMIKGNTSLSKFADMVVSESGYKTMLQQSKAPESKTRLENIKELIQSLGHFSTLQEFLEHVSLVSENNTQNDHEDMVTLMTLHSAKGQEFDAIYLCGWEEGLFPNSMSIQEDNLEEERRLAYVGITRAKKFVFITHAFRRLVYNQWQTTIPSRFINEIPKESIIKKQISRPFNNSCFFSGNTITSNSDFDESNKMERSRVPCMGDHVLHKHYGNGVVIDVNASSVEVDFDDFGIKKMLPEFLQTT